MDDRRNHALNRAAAEIAVAPPSRTRRRARLQGDLLCEVWNERVRLLAATDDATRAQVAALTCALAAAGFATRAQMVTAAAALIAAIEGVDAELRGES